MIQFNLLPDVKLEYIKAERTKKLVVSIAVLSGAVALSILVLLMLVVNVVQKKNLSDLNKDIAAKTSQIKSTPNLDKILTIQSQLSALPGLHDQKPAASRLFAYIGQVTPSTVTINNVTNDFTQQTMTITGEAPSLDAVNTFVDTLKFTNYTTDKTTGETKAFSNVVLGSFGRSDDGASFSITLTFDPIIFNVADKVELKVPNTVTTRSVTEQPSVFEQARDE